MKTALSDSFKAKYGAKFLGLTVSTAKPARRRLKRRRLAKTKFYITAILAGKASELSSGVTDFVSKKLKDSLKTICTKAKPCTVSAPTVSVAQASENVKKGSGSGTAKKGPGAEGKGSGSGDLNVPDDNKKDDGVKKTDKMTSTDNS